MSDKPEYKEQIEKIRLGECINKYIEDNRIKGLAKRAAWLGNDETHYRRMWTDKDSEDLHTLLRITINAVENALLARKYIEDMPEKKG